MVLTLERLSVEQALLAVAALAALTTILNYFFHRRQVKRLSDLTFLLLPVFWIIASTAVVFLMPVGLWQYSFALVLAVAFLKLLVSLQPRVMTATTDNFFFLSSVGIFLGIWALDFYFTPGWWEIILLVFLSSIFLFWFGFDTTPGEDKEKLFYSFVLAFVFAQLSWALLFWPLHFISLTVVTAGLFYLSWLISRMHLLGILNRKKIVFHSVFSLLIALLVAVTATWLPRG